MFSTDVAMMMRIIMGNMMLPVATPRQNTVAFLASSAIRFTKTKVSLRVFTQRFVVGPAEEAALAGDDQ